MLLKDIVAVIITRVELFLVSNLSDNITGGKIVVSGREMITQ